MRTPASRLSARAPLVLLFAMAAIAGAAAEWRAIGPGGGGAQFRPTLSGLDPRLVVVGTDMNAGFVSENLGESWRRFHLRASLQTVLFDPVDRDAIFVLMPGDLGFYRSPDRGRSWHLVYPPASAVERVAHIDDEAEARLVTRPAAGEWPPIRAIAGAGAAAAARGVFYAVRGSSLEISQDGGARWRKLAPVAGQPIRGTGHSLFVLDNAPVLAVVEADSVEFWEGGPSTRVSAPPGVTRILEAAAGSGSLYLLTEPAALWVTRDRGRSWVNLTAGLAALSFRGKTLAELRGLAAAARQGNHLYISYSGLPSMLDTLFGVARSTDGGATWKLMWQDGQRRGADPRVRDNWLNAAFGPTWGENPLEIGVHPDHPELVFGTDYGRTMRSTDGGANWQGVYSRAAGSGWTTRGLDVTTSYGVHFDPHAPARRMFISYTDIGLFRSEDGGASWMASSAGMPNEWRNTTYWLEMDPQVPGRAWAATSNIHDLPRMKMVRRWRPEEKKWHGGVCATKDGGRTWTRSNQGLPDAPVTHVLLDHPARSKPGARTLYAAAFGAGVYKSLDDGVTWSARSKGIDSGAWPLVWRLTMDRDGVLYAVVTRRREALEFGDAATDGAVYRSRDGAATWERMALPAGLNGPHGIAVDPGNPRRLYLAAFGRFEPDSLATPKQGGVFLSEDAGRTWRNVLAEDQYVYDVTVDPQRPEVLFATGYQSSLWRSGDRGLRWQRVPGFNVKNAHRAIPDPRHAGMVFVTSYGSSVWYGPEWGDPGSVEDIVTPEVRYGTRPQKKK